MNRLNVGDLVIIEHIVTGAKKAIVLCHNWQERKVEVYLIGEGRARTLHDSRVSVLSRNTNDRGTTAII